MKLGQGKDCVRRIGVAKMIQLSGKYGVFVTIHTN